MSGESGENELIAILERSVRVNRPDVVTGIGDDAAIVRPPPGSDLVLTTDTLVSGIHFAEDSAPADVGWKALAVNLSDLAAMGAEPAWALLSVSTPRADTEWIAGFAGGFAELAEKFEVALVGGDTTRGPLAVTVQAAGFAAPGAGLRRDGARPGQGVYVTGTLGDAAGALAVLQGELEVAGDWAPLRARLDRPQPRVAAGLRLAGLASACIDLSDGLAVDLERVLAASGCGANLELADLPVSPALRALVADDSRLRKLQMAGDDYELCFTADPDRHEALLRLGGELDVAITRVGEIHGGRGLTFLDQGRPSKTPATGWRHFGAGGE